jgi:hypothetical protein
MSSLSSLTTSEEEFFQRLEWIRYCSNFYPEMIEDRCRHSADLMVIASLMSEHFTAYDRAYETPRVPLGIDILNRIKKFPTEFVQEQLGVFADLMSNDAFSRIGKLVNDVNVSDWQKVLSADGIDTETNGDNSLQKDGSEESPGEDQDVDVYNSEEQYQSDYPSETIVTTTTGS